MSSGKKQKQPSGSEPERVIVFFGGIFEHDKVLRKYPRVLCQWV